MLDFVFTALQQLRQGKLIYYLSVCSRSMCFRSFQDWLAECTFSLHVCSWLVNVCVVEGHPMEICLSLCDVQQLWHDSLLCIFTFQLFHSNWSWQLHDLCTLSWSCARSMARCLAYAPWLGETLAGKYHLWISSSVSPIPRRGKAGSYGYICAYSVVNMPLNS